MTVRAKQVNVTICNSWDSTHATKPLFGDTVSLKPCWFCKTTCSLAQFQRVTVSIQEFLIWQLPRQSSPGVLMVFLQADRVAEDLTPACGLHGGIAKHSKRTHGVVASSDRPHLETIHSLEAEYEIQAAAEAQR